MKRRNCRTCRRLYKKSRKINIEDVMQQREFVDFGNVTYTEKQELLLKYKMDVIDFALIVLFHMHEEE